MLSGLTPVPVGFAGKGVSIPFGFPIGPGFPFSVPFGLYGVELSGFLGSIIEQFARD